MSSQIPHIRIYKAAVHHPLLGWIFHHKSEIPYLSGYYLRIYCTVIDVMLPRTRTLWILKTFAPLFYLTLKQTIPTTLLEKKQ